MTPRSLGLIGLMMCLALLSSERPPTRSWDWKPGRYDTLLRTLPLRPQALQFPGGRATFDAVNERLAQALLDGTGSLRVVHVGGSHVQAGWMGDQIRQRWLDLAGTTCSRGLIAPYRMAGTNTPPKVRTEFTGSWSGNRCSRSRHQGPFGGTGLSAVTFDESATWWHVAVRSDSSRYFSEVVTVLGESNGLRPRWDGPETGVSVAPLEGATGWRMAFDAPVDTLFLGLEPDSGAVEGPRWFRLHGLVAESPSCPCEGLVYHEIGNNGASTASVLRGVGDEAFARDWQALAPDLVIFGIGINDAHGPAERFDADAFVQRYDSLVGAIQAVAPETAFLYLTNTDSYYGRRPNPSALAVREAMFSLAKRQGAAVFDLFDAMGGLGSVQVWEDAGFARSDRIHFTRDGYRVLADLYWDALLDSWTESDAVERRRVRIQSPDRTQPTDSLTWKS